MMKTGHQFHRPRNLRQKYVEQASVAGARLALSAPPSRASVGLTHSHKSRLCHLLQQREACHESPSPKRLITQRGWRLIGDETLEPAQRQPTGHRILGRINAQPVSGQLAPHPGGLNGAFRRLSSRL